MKKLLTVAIIAILMFSFAACSGGNDGGDDGFTTTMTESEIFSNEDFDSAVGALEEYFESFEGCTLKSVSYAGDDEVKAEAEYQGLDPELVMVLKSTFETDGEDHQNGLEPNHTYEDYKWIFTRQTTDGSWEHKDHGYG
jgi:hypothetical protein